MQKNSVQEWVDWYLSLPRAKYFVRIDKEFLHNISNYYGIKQKINHFDAAFQLMINNNVPPELGNMELDSEAWLIEQQAEILYGFIHSLYIMTSKGLSLMKEKYDKGEFPKCPRVLCNGIYCLPYGISETINEYSVKLYCPNCNDIFNKTDKNIPAIDGAFFGPSWVHSFVLKYPTILPKELPHTYIPKLFGFTIIHPEEEES